MPEKEHGLHVGGVRVVVILDDGTDARRRCIAVHIMPQDDPAISAQVRDQLRELGGQRRGEGVVHQEHHFPSEINHGHLDA